MGDNFKGEFNRAKADIFKFVTDINRFGQQVNKLGTNRDTAEFRRRITALQGDLTERAHKIGSSLVSLKNLSKGAGTSERHEVDKLIGETQEQLTRFKQLQEECKRVMEKSVPKLPPNQSPSSAPQDPFAARVGPHSQMMGQQMQSQLHPSQQQSQVQEEQVDLLLENQINYHEQIIEERDQGIQEINVQISEVNEIFQDLAVLVVDQGETVEVIDNNIGRTAQNVEDGRKQLKGAEKHQKGATRRLWCLFGIVVIVLVVVIIFLMSVHL